MSTVQRELTEKGWHVCAVQLSRWESWYEKKAFQNDSISEISVDAQTVG